MRVASTAPAVNVSSKGEISVSSPRTPSDAGGVDGRRKAFSSR
jgi:hypothetical protein